jgi:gas vesicle protein
MRTGKVVLLGTLAGLAIGAISGLLFAPEKGSNTRKQIKDNSNEYMNELKTKFAEFRDSLAGKRESTRREAKNLVAKGKARFDYAKNNVKNAASDFKHPVS